MRFSMGLAMMDCRSQHGSRRVTKSGLGVVCRLRRQKIGVARMGTHAPRYSWAGSREIFLNPAAATAAAPDAATAAAATTPRALPVKE